MTPKKPSNNLVTESYLEEKLSKNTTEIIEVIHEVAGRQTEIMFQILEEIRGTKQDTRNHDTRLNDHDVRIEKLEKTAN